MTTPAPTTAARGATPSAAASGGEGGSFFGFSAYEWMVARRYLGATKAGKFSLITIIAYVAISLAVMTLIVVMSVMQGFRLTLLDQLLGTNGHAFLQSDEPIGDYDAITANVEAIPGVVRATPLIELPIYASAYGETGALVRGVRRKDILATPHLSGPDSVVSGSFDTFGVGRKGGDEIAIGSRVANALGVRAGDSVTLLTARGSETAFGRSPRQKSYRVGAIYHVGNAEYDSLYIFMPLEQAQLFFKYGDATQQIEIKVDDPIAVKRYRDAIGQAAPGFYLLDWQQKFQSYFSALGVERFIMRLILFLIIVVASLNIVSGLVMLVRNKTPDIAVMRTMGATQGAVLRIFFLSGALIGVAGTITGVVLGIAFVLNVDAIETALSWAFRTDLFPAETYLLDGVPAKLEWAEVASVAGFSLATSFLTTLFPARRAAGLDPVVALRNS
ncbi:MAG: lipoprotein-releasing ABC transporter permease subunit [Pseudomonadota bacterium]